MRKIVIYGFLESKRAFPFLGESTTRLRSRPRVDGVLALNARQVRSIIDDFRHGPDIDESRRTAFFYYLISRLSCWTGRVEADCAINDVNTPPSKNHQSEFINLSRDGREATVDRQSNRESWREAAGGFSAIWPGFKTSGQTSPMHDPGDDS